MAARAIMIGADVIDTTGGKHQKEEWADESATNEKNGDNSKDGFHYLPAFCASGIRKTYSSYCFRAFAASRVISASVSGRFGNLFISVLL